MARPELSIVVPAFRQAETIVRDLRLLQALLTRIAPRHEIILVIDGDHDETRAQVEHIPELTDVTIIRWQQNQGKGQALRHGLAAAQGQFVGYVDAGGDLDLAYLELMFIELKLTQADVVIGSKRHLLSHVSYPPIRHVYSWLFQMLQRLFFNLTVSDTQVGMKLFRREVIEEVLPRVTVKRFAFDLELLVIAHACGFRRIIEAPVHIAHDFSSSVNIIAVWQTVYDTALIWYQLNVRRLYDAPAPTIPRLSRGVTLTVHGQELESYSKQVEETVS